MKYRAFGKTGWNVSALGFGAMRLPSSDSNRMGPVVDEEKSIEMIRRAVDCGVNYIDSAYVYHGGRSEVIVGKALKDGYRSKARIATKLPTWSVKESSDFDTFLNEQLRRFDTDHIDFYLFHALDRQRWKSVLDLGLLERAEAARKAGKIGHIGFSFHDDADAFMKIIDGYDGWEFCQIQYNYMDAGFQAGTAGLEHAAKKGIPVIVMEPIRGGRLAMPPDDVAEIFKAHPSKRSAVEWALHWVWNRPEVTLVLSGMSTMQQVDENCAAAEGSDPGSFGASELEVIRKVSDIFKSRAIIPCTSCGYCVPCPQCVDIPRNFELYNDAVIYANPANARFTYANFVAEENRASNCIGCKVCEEKCPQKIDISGWMPKVHAMLG
jgi:uncharacterized protein